MSRQSGGRKIYLLEKGRPAGLGDIVDIFDGAELGQVCSVAEQRSNFDSWINSLRKGKSAVMHEITEEVVAAAKANPGGWVYKIEGQFGPDEAVPPHAIVGAWKVDSAGELTGEFVENPNYRQGERSESSPSSSR